jgi:galactosyl transferase GMA12/MNN10 family
MIKIITACDDSPKFRELSAICRYSIRKYCRRHSHEFAFHTIHESARPPSWYKIPLIKRELQQKRIRYCLWMDADSLIYNQRFDIRSLLRPGKSLYLSEDVNGLNAGVMLWKNTPANHRLLDKIWSMERFIHRHWWEQLAMMELVRNNHRGIRERIEYVPQKILNAYDYELYDRAYHPGQRDADSFIAHYPGLGHEIRKERMEKRLRESCGAGFYQFYVARALARIAR